MEEVPKPKENEKIFFVLKNQEDLKNKIVVRVEELSFSYGKRLVFDKISFTIRAGEKVALIGENGVGKTTLLNLIKNSHEKITITPKAKIGFWHQQFEELDSNRSLLENVLMCAEIDEVYVRRILARLLFDTSDMNKTIEMLSGGEKVKLAFAKLLVADFNILILDEITNYLDTDSVEIFMELLNEYQGTVIFVSHDRKFVNFVATSLIIINNKKIIYYNGSLDEYERI